MTDSQQNTNIQQLLIRSFARWPVSGENLLALRENSSRDLLLKRAQTNVLAPCRQQGITGVQPLGFHPLFSLYIAHEVPKAVAKRGNEAEVLRVIAPPPPADIAQLSATH